MAAARSRQLTPEETIEAVTRVAAHVPVQVVADHFGVSAEVVLSAVNKAKANRAARGLPAAPQVEATPGARNGRASDVVASSAPTPPPQASEPTRRASVKSVDAADLYTFEELCKWADGVGINRATMLAERVRVAVQELRAMLRRRDEIDARKAKVAQAEEQLAEARAQLWEITGSPRSAYRSKASRDGASTSTIRAWAIENGYDVEPRGLLKNAVVDAYHAAHAKTGAP